MSNENIAHKTVQAWFDWLKEEFPMRYYKEDRREHLEALASWFIQDGISEEDAEMQKNAVVKILVTKEGMKGKSECS